MLGAKVLTILAAVVFQPVGIEDIGFRVKVWNPN
jgi:hypothetical protein